MNARMKGAWVAAALAGVAALSWYLAMRTDAPPAVSAAPSIEPALSGISPGVPDEPPHYPIASLPDAAPAASATAPPDSDTAVRDALAGLFGASLDKYFNTSDIVRRIVVTVDNLPREAVARRLMPVRPVPGVPVTAGHGGTRVLDAANDARYDTYVRLAEMVPTARLVDVYRRHYPLFQRHYVELGYPDGYFNNRLVEVIDHLLATPAVPSPIRLRQPKVLYTFADPELENLSEGQKIMLRMGERNAARIRARLSDIRAEVTRQP